MLICIAHGSSTFDAFEAPGGYAVHVLGHDQEELARRFATTGMDRFAGLEWRPGFDGAPILPGCLAVFECALERRYEGGDHMIYVGRVARFTLDESERDVLGYLRGRYDTASGLGEEGPAPGDTA